MSYVKKTWVNDEIITASDLNRMEDGIDYAVDKADNGGLYGVRWDRTTNLLTRIKDAENITTDTTNFKHSGTFNPNINNPFDLLYPWSDIKVCNVDLTAYAALSSGDSVRDCITAVYGDPDFTYFGSDSLFVGVYIPEFWYWSEEDSSGKVSFYISTNNRVGFKHHEEEIRGISFAIDAGNSKVSSGAGVPLANVAVSTIHSRAHNQGFTITDIFSDDAVIMLYLVEYANMNAQAALGDGCSSCYRENAADVIANLDNSGTETVFEVTDSVLSSLIYKGTQVDFGASVGATTYKAVVKDFAVSGDTYTITLDRKLSDLTNGMYMSVHGFATCEFPYIGQSVGNGSGYIGTNSKANAYYRGMMLWGNRYRYTLGIYRESGTNHIWVCPDGVDPDNYDALNTSVHQDTETVLPVMGSGAWLTVGGNAQRIAELCGFMATGTSSGSSSSPVGDQQYVPQNSAGNTILLSGGVANYGWACGLFCGYWNGGAGYSWWDVAASPLLKKPQ